MGTCVIWDQGALPDLEVLTRSESLLRRHITRGTSWLLTMSLMPRETNLNGLWIAPQTGANARGAFPQKDKRLLVTARIVSSMIARQLLQSTLAGLDRDKCLSRKPLALCQRCAFSDISKVRLQDTDRTRGSYHRYAISI